jgi:hypothetical protein
VPAYCSCTRSDCLLQTAAAQPCCLRRAEASCYAALSGAQIVRSITHRQGHLHAYCMETRRRKGGCFSVSSHTCQSLCQGMIATTAGHKSPRCTHVRLQAGRLQCCRYRWCPCLLLARLCRAVGTLLPSGCYAVVSTPLPVSASTKSEQRCLLGWADAALHKPLLVEVGERCQCQAHACMSMCIANIQRVARRASPCGTCVGI